MVCKGCKKQKHQKCKNHGKLTSNWCDCQCRVTVDGIPPEVEVGK